MNINLTIIIFLILIITGRFIAMIYRHPQKSSVKKTFNDKTIFVAMMIPIVCISLPIIEYFMKNRNTVIVISALGSLIVISGFMVNLFANKAIGTNWSASIEKNDTRKLVTSGIYKHVRHPLYFSGLLIFIGTLVYFQSWFSAIALIPFFLLINWRINHEEKELELLFPDDYPKYKESTKKIIPYVY